MAEATGTTPAANLPREARAMLVAIAQGESDPTARREGISPYVILVGGGSFEGMRNRDGYHGFPDWSGKEFPSGISHAAGRYQFEPATWKSIADSWPAGVPNFRDPGDQDWGAWFLAQRDYQAKSGGALLLADLQSERVKNIAGTLQSTWTSLSDSTFPERYAAALATIPATPAQPPPIVIQSPPVLPPVDTDTSADDLNRLYQAWNKLHPGVPFPTTAQPKPPISEPPPVVSGPPAEGAGGASWGLPPARTTPGVAVGGAAGFTVSLGIVLQWIDPMLHLPVMSDPQAGALAAVITTLGALFIHTLAQRKASKTAGSTP